MSNRPDADEIQRLRDALRLMLANFGRPFSVVYTPPQDITEGYLQFVVIESVAGEVRVEGNRYFSADSYLSRMAQPVGEPITDAALNTGLDRINRNAFRNAVTRVEPGTAPGTTDVVIQVQEQRPWRFFGGYNNTGTRTTTEDRINAGVNWGNALGRGHQATLQVITDLEAKYSRTLSGNYGLDLPGNQNLTVFGAYSEIESVPTDSLSQDGLSWQLGLNYDLPLGEWGPGYTHGLILGADFKVSDNNLEFALPPTIIPVSDNLTQIAQVRAEYRGTLEDRFGATSWGFALTGAPGGLTAENTDEAFEGSRFGAKAAYVYGRFDASREVALDRWVPGMSWIARGSFQLASGNLLGSEQMAAGGFGSVRGYEQGEVIGDNGVFVSQELNFPGFAIASRFAENAPRDRLSPFVFQDYARVWNVDKLAGERPFNLMSVGAGARYQFSRHGNLQAAYGWQLRDSGSSDTGRDSHLHLSVNLSF